MQGLTAGSAVQILSADEPRGFSRDPPKACVSPSPIKGIIGKVGFCSSPGSAGFAGGRGGFRARWVLGAASRSDDGWGDPTRFPVPALHPAFSPPCSPPAFHLPSRGPGQLGGLGAPASLGCLSFILLHPSAQGDPAPARLRGEHSQGWDVSGRGCWGAGCHSGALLAVPRPLDPAPRRSPRMGRVPEGTPALTPEPAGASLLPPSLSQRREEGTRHAQAWQWLQHPRRLCLANLLHRCAPR